MDGSRARQPRTGRPVVKPRDGLHFVPLAGGDVDTVAWRVLDGDHVVGEARFVRDRTDRRIAEVAFAVLPTHQRRGIARRLLETLSVLAAARGIRTFTYSVPPENRAAMELLRSFGGRHVLVDGRAEGSAPVPLTRTPDIDRLAVLARDSAATLLPVVEVCRDRALAGAAA